MSIFPQEITNTFSRYALSTALEAGTMALASTLLANPLGITGGALLGGGLHLTKILLKEGSDELLNVKEPKAIESANILSNIITFFGSHIAAWTLLTSSYFAYPLILRDAIIFGAVSVISSEVLGLAEKVHQSVVRQLTHKTTTTFVVASATSTTTTTHVTKAVAHSDASGKHKAPQPSEGDELVTHTPQRIGSPPPPVVTGGAEPGTVHTVVQKFEHGDVTLTGGSSPREYVEAKTTA